MHLGPAELPVAVTLDSRDDLPGGQVEHAAAELTRRLEAAHPEVTRIVLRPGRVPGAAIMGRALPVAEALPKG